MISHQQFKRIFKSQRYVLPLLMLLAFAWQMLYVVILSSSAMRKLAEAYFAIMPPAFKKFMSIMGSGFSGEQFLAFGYTHPSMLFILSFVPVAIAGRFITAEMEGRSIELLAIRLFPRSRLVMTTWLYTFVAHALLFSAMMGGTLAGQAATALSDGLPAALIVKIILSGLLFFTAINSMITFAATLFDNRGKAMAWGIGFLLIAFIFDALVKVWEQAAFLKNYSLFHWYQPVDIVNGKYDYGVAIAVLALLTLFFLGAAVVHFSRRDM
ncbi:MAG TPA: hypothetical protein ENJ15_02700 [Caldithrix abyssi]|uniref:ABC transporter permease n=1 Tax=Caldithrix abyssi TaxID=187145 RepID=A0A7V5RNL5_CALAY|nr:hypothetical protein [Caldithrix abyssi]